MSLFVAACDAVRQTFFCTVFGLHHTNKNGGMRGSTVMPGAGDFIIEMLREPQAMSGSIRAAKIKAAEDGWEQAFKVEKIELPGIVLHTSLVLVPVTATARPQGGRGWPDIAVCRDILAGIDDQWMRGQPWCHATNSSRSAVSNIMQKWNLPRPVVKDILEKWNAEGVIEEAMRDTRLHIKGYRKLASI
jgi:hypothetical protein